MFKIVQYTINQTFCKQAFFKTPGLDIAAGILCVEMEDCSQNKQR